MEQKQIEKDSKPDELVDEVVEVNHTSVSSYSKNLKLSPSEKVRCRNVEQT